MTPAARVQAAIELLDHLLSGTQPADRALKGYFRSRRYAGSRDRAAVGELVYGVLRDLGRARLHAGGACSARQAVLVHLAGETPGPEELFTGTGHAPAALEPSEHALLSSVREFAEDMPAWARANCPEWLFERFVDAFGGEAEAEIAALNARAPVDLRVNLLKTNRERVLEVLAGDGIEAAPMTLSPTALRLAARSDVTAHWLYQQGHVEIQDAGSQRVADLCAAAPGEQIVDYCAGGGGKSLALAARMEGRGQIYACDTDARRLARLKPRLDRARAHNIQTHVLASSDPWLEELAGKVDCVLIDAPCSGSGAWRRQPEARWQLSAARLSELCALQLDILTSAADLVKAGGRLVYATCSLLPEENERVVGAFLAAHPQFAQRSAGDRGDQDGYLRLTPLRHDADGFFVAVLHRL